MDRSFFTVVLLTLPIRFRRYALMVSAERVPQRVAVLTRVCEYVGSSTRDEQ